MKIRTDICLYKDRQKITKTIANFWNKTSEGWRLVWGPHIHHGYYENHSESPLQAQEKLISKLIERLDIFPGAKILDVGCGMGGSSLYLAKHHQAHVTGITLSKKQLEIASAEAAKQNIQNVSFQIEDALALNSFKDHSFDIVWSLESCEQFYDKELFLKQAIRILKPQGQLMLATWCSDREEYQDQLAKKYQKLCRAFDLPYMPTISHYQTLLKRQNFIVNESLDWSTQVAKSWDIGISLLNVYSLLKQFRVVGFRGIRFARQIKLMQEAFHQGRVKYGVFIAKTGCHS